MIRANRPVGPGIDELQRISGCMLGEVAPASLAHEAVLDMEMGLLRQGWPVGQSLGALPDVRKRLGLGRPAFREAVTILEARGLLDVRRGPGGGLFVAYHFMWSVYPNTSMIGCQHNFHFFIGDLFQCLM